MDSLLFFGFFAVCINSFDCAVPPKTENVFSRAIGSSGPMDTISVPYMSKPTFFPKMVDPKTMISKKTDFLGNLFGSPVKEPEMLTPYKSYESLSSSPMQMFPKSYITSKYDASFDPATMKRGIFSPFGPGSSSSPFFPPKPKFPFGSSGSFDPSLYETASFDLTSRRKRSITEEDSKIASEEPEPRVLETLVGPSMYGPVVDPSMFISKKSEFLDSLFKNLATTTTPSPDTVIAKSKIVPPNFWIPSTIPVDPMDYSTKMSTFLDQLFDKIKNNISDTSAALSKRSIENTSSITTAKDSVTNMILDELTNLKNEMIGNFNDLIAYEKTVTSTPPTSKKPFKPFLPGMWPSKPVFDPTTGFKQKMTILNEVFDMLNELQKNISSSFTDIKPTTPLPISSISKDFPNVNLTILEAIKSKLASMQDSALNSATPDYFFAKSKRDLETKTANSIWVSPKTEIDNKSEPELINDKEVPRSIKMQQGYPNMPPDAVQSILAGGRGTEAGSQDENDLFYRAKNNWKNWADYMRQRNEGNEFQGHDHHHHRH